MDKATLMRNFQAVASHASGLVMSEKCKLCALPLTGLKKIELSEARIKSQQLDKQICCEGRVMYANICNTTKVEGRTMVLCLVEQENDPCAAFLHIFNALTSSSRPQDAEAFFPKGSRIAIKEPVCFSQILQVSSPASVEFVGITNASSGKPVGDLVKEANALLSSRSFVLADLYYTEVLNILKQQQQVAGSALEKEVLSNRAEVRLEMGRYEEAVIDAEAAVKLKPKRHHVKSLWIQGKGLTALQEHKLALSCFQSIAALEWEDMNAPRNMDKDLEKSKSYVQQSEHGEFDITNCVLGRKQEPDCSDYFGPLEMRMTPDGRGRGVYLTRDVKRGDLLMVCNPTAAVKCSRYEDADGDSYVELIRACTTSYRRLIHVYAMADAAEMTTVPDLDAFKCNVGKVKTADWSNQVVDTNRIKRVRDRCGFTSKAGSAWVAGVWALTGFFNHSCTPNASKVCFGKVMFVRAARDLKAGDEVLISYMEMSLLAPFSKRQAKFHRLGFECKCRRCVLEKDNSELILKYDALSSSIANADGDKKKKKLLLSYALEVEEQMRMASLKDEEKDWIRAALADIYSAACTSKHPSIPTADRYLEVLHEIGPGNFETLARMATLYSSSASNFKSLELLREEVVALFGQQRPEILDAVISKFKISGFATALGE